MEYAQIQVVENASFAMAFLISPSLPALPQHPQRVQTQEHFYESGPPLKTTLQPAQQWASPSDPTSINRRYRSSFRSANGGFRMAREWFKEQLANGKYNGLDPRELDYVKTTKALGNCACRMVLPVKILRETFDDRDACFEKRMASCTMVVSAHGLDNRCDLCSLSGIPRTGNIR